MTELSRRRLMLLAGAGLAASACKRDSGNSDRSNKGSRAQQAPLAKSPFAFAAGCELHGENPHDDPPSSTTGIAYRYPAFVPDYMAVLYLGLLNEWNIRVNHASYHLPGAGEGERLTKAQNVLGDMVPTNKRFRDFERTRQPYRRRDGSFDGDSFRTFGFKSQNELFIYLHHPSIRLDTHPIISFGAFGQDRTSRTRNYSFFNAEEVFAGNALDRVGKMIRIRNYVKNERATDITAADQRYAMNIHFTVDAGAAGRIALIIDPDTGNGTGHEP